MLWTASAFRLVFAWLLVYLDTGRGKSLNGRLFPKWPLSTSASHAACRQAEIWLQQIAARPVQVVVSCQLPVYQVCMTAACACLCQPFEQLPPAQARAEDTALHDAAVTGAAGRPAFTLGGFLGGWASADSSRDCRACCTALVVSWRKAARLAAARALVQPELAGSALRVLQVWRGMRLVYSCD